jgi:chitinase
MCYDEDSYGYITYSWYNSSLFQAGNPGLDTCAWIVGVVLDSGIAASKLGIGIAFYGRKWENVSTPEAAVSYPATVSTVFYNDVVLNPLLWKPEYQFYDSVHKANYLSIAPLNEFISLTGTQQIVDTVSWTNASGFGGLMTFSLSYEYLSGQTGDARYPLSTALYDAAFKPQPPQGLHVSVR